MENSLLHKALAGYSSEIRSNIKEMCKPYSCKNSVNLQNYIKLLKKLACTDMKCTTLYEYKINEIVLELSCRNYMTQVSQRPVHECTMEQMQSWFLMCAPGVAGQTSESRLPRTCCICLERPPTHVVVPCGHKCLCATCSHSLKRCPLCRTKVAMICYVYD